MAVKVIQTAINTTQLSGLYYHGIGQKFRKELGR